MKHISHKKMITCIVQVGVAKATMKAEHEKFGLLQMQFNFARGIGKRTYLATQGWDEKAEKEILSITLAEDIADEVFEFLYFQTSIHLPHHGILYMHSVHKATQYTLPEGLDLNATEYKV